MNAVKVKICGIRNKESAVAAECAGADFIGFNFIPTSKRFIHPSEAKKIISRLLGKVKVVGVFQNAESVEVNRIISLVGLDYVQLHGQEDAQYVKKIKGKVIKTITPDSMTREIIQTYNADFILLDRQKQGEGEMVDREKAKQIRSRFQTFIAGGLTPENVAEVISSIKPFGVDVAGGIETKGVVDSTKIQLFIQTAKGVIL